MSESPSASTVPPSTSTAIHPTDPSLPSLSSATSTYTGPGRCVFTLAYQSFYVTEVDKWKRKFPGIKEKKLEGKVRRGWDKKHPIAEEDGAVEEAVSMGGRNGEGGKKKSRG